MPQIDRVNAPTFLLVLIHGTFDKTASWIKPGSGFRELVRSSIGNNVDFDSSFAWSGRNTHDARLQAGSELCHHLTELVRKNRTARIFLIGHSHGGNVALYALRDNAFLRRNIYGVVTIGTPFFCRERDDVHWWTMAPIEAIPPVMSVLFPLALLCGTFGIGFWALNNLPRDFFWLTLPVWSLFFAWIILRSPCRSFEVALEWSFKSIERISRGRISKTIERYLSIRQASIVSGVATPVLCLKAVTDEAAWLLNSLDMWSQVPSRLLKWSSLGVITSGGLFVAGIIIGRILPAAGPVLAVPGALVFVLSVFYWLVFVIAGMILSAIRWPGFGLANNIPDWLLGYSTSDRPDLALVSAPNGVVVPEVKGQSKLAHCRLLISDEAVSLMSTWISRGTGDFVDTTIWRESGRSRLDQVSSGIAFLIMASLLLVPSIVVWRITSHFLN